MTLKPLPEYKLKELYPNKKTLSSSQFLKYEESPSDFYIEYVCGVKKEPSAPMLIGSIFSALYEDRTLDYKAHLHEAKAPKRIPDLFEQAIALMPVQKNGHPEYPLIAKYRGWSFRATLDDFVEPTYTVIENKTGKAEWNQERVNFSDQLTFQAWCHWKKYGVVPRAIILNWVDTSAHSKKTIQTFKTTRSIRAMTLFEARIDVVLYNLEAGNFTRPIYE